MMLVPLKMDVNKVFWHTFLRCSNDLTSDCWKGAVIVWNVVKENCCLKI